METTELIRNCPNCGCMGMLRVKRKNNGYRFWVECADCWTETNRYHLAEEAIEEWNNMKKLDNASD